MSVLLTSGMTPPPTDEEIREGIQTAIRWMAAAPDLLAALRNVTFALAWHCREGHGPVAMDEKFLADATAAIAKAEGGS